jgi:hypothetical protein
MGAPTISQPSYPGGGPYGQMPNFIPLNIGNAGTSNATSSILGGSAAQDLYTQQQTLKNFAQMYPMVNQAQLGYQSQLGTNLNAVNGLNSWTPGSITSLIGSGFGLMNAGNAGVNKFSGMMTGGPGTQALKTIQNAGQGIFSNPNFSSAYNTLGQEASGAQPINPIVQQTMMESGLASAGANLGAGAFTPGGTGAGNLATGQLGESEVARQLGVNAEQYMQNMQNAGLGGLQQLNTDVTQVPEAYLQQLQGLTGTSLGVQQAGAGEIQNGVGLINQQQTLLNQQMAEEGQMFPRTQIGLSGTDLANMMIQNTTGQNQFNQANFASQMAAAQYNSSINAQNAGLQASSSSGLISGGLGIASAAVMVAAFCGLAIKVLGTQNQRWLIFRHWVHNHAGKRIRNQYLRVVRDALERAGNEPGISDFIGSFVGSGSPCFGVSIC